MPAKITRRFKKVLNLTQAKRAWGKRAVKDIKKGVIERIESGNSPVESGGRSPKNTGGKAKFEKYSPSYKKSIREGRVDGKSRVSPVDLKATGKLHNSLKSRVKASGLITMWFSDKKAKFHDKLGAGKSKVIRRLLPKKGERFTKKIRDKMLNRLRVALKQNTKTRN